MICSVAWLSGFSHSQLCQASVVMAWTLLDMSIFRRGAETAGRVFWQCVSNAECSGPRAFAISVMVCAETESFTTMLYKVQASERKHTESINNRNEARPDRKNIWHSPWLSLRCEFNVGLLLMFQDVFQHNVLGTIIRRHIARNVFEGSCHSIRFRSCSFTITGNDQAPGSKWCVCVPLEALDRMNTTMISSIVSWLFMLSKLFRHFWCAGMIFR